MRQVALGLGAFLVLLLVGATGELTAQEMLVATDASLVGIDQSRTFVCEKCRDEEPGGPHEFTETGDGAFFDCSSGNGCHLEPRTGSCSGVHKGCTAEQEDLQALAVAIEAGNVVSLQAAMGRFASARVNAARGSVDIECGDVLIARVDAPEHRRSWLAAAASAPALEG